MYIIVNFTSQLKKCYTRHVLFTTGKWSLNPNKAVSQNFLEFCSVKFQVSCQKSNMRQQAAPLKGSQSVNKSTERTWPRLTDGLSQRHIPVESTIHFTLSTRTPLHTHAHASPLYSLFLLLTHTVLYTGVLGLCCPLYPNKTLPITNHKYILHSQSCAHTHCLFNTHHSFHKCLNLIATIQM